jgi:hypothetical protein
MHPDIRVRESAIEGRGVYANRLIPQGTTLWKLTEATGIYVTSAKFRQLPVNLRCLAYRYRDRFFLSSDGSQFMNHSCDPNTHWLDDETMAASRDIQPDEEVTFDYATSDVHPWWREKWSCSCGAAGCRGVITGRDCLVPAFAARYRGYLPSWTVDFMRRHRGLRGHLSWLLFVGAGVARKVRALALRRSDEAPSRGGASRAQKAHTVP